MISDDFSNQHRQFRILGICWMVYGFIRLIVAFWLVSFSNTASMMFGSLLGRVPDPFSLMNSFHVIYAVAVVWSVLCGALGLLAGAALMAGQRSARTLTLFAAILSLSEIPVGTTLGIYSIIVLLPARVLNASASSTHQRTPALTSHRSTL